MVAWAVHLREDVKFALYRAASRADLTSAEYVRRLIESDDQVILELEAAADQGR